jgi:iron complex outermembrane receptor protein
MTIRNKTSLILLGSALIFSSAAMAEDEFDIDALYADDEFVSIATGSDKPIRLAPSVASVITAKDIQNAGAIDIEQVLEMVPGLHVSRSPTNRLNTIYSIRGIQTSENPQVILLLDGIKFQEQFNGTRDNRLKIPVSAIKRVEIIRGPGSAVFGADAFAGVINIITKSGVDVDGTEISALAGSFDTYGSSLLHGRSVAGWDVMANIEYQKSRGDQGRLISSDFQSILDLAPGSDFSEAPGPLQTDYELAQAQLKVSNATWFFDFKTIHMLRAGQGAGGALALDSVGFVEWEFYQLELAYKFKQGDWDSRLAFHTNYREQDNVFRLLPPGAVVPVGDDGNLFTGGNLITFVDGVYGNPGTEDLVTQLSYQTFYSAFDDHLLRLELGYENLQGNPSESKNFGPGVLDLASVGTMPAEVGGDVSSVTGTDFVFSKWPTREIWFASLQDEWKLAADWQLTAGLRYDHYSDFGETFNPRMALVWASSYNSTTKFMYGRAFRAPSISEQFAINNPSVLGNDALNPETIDTFEIAFDYRPTLDSQLQINAYSYQIEDLISLVGVQYQNVRNQEGYGYEIEYRIDIYDHWALLANFAWQHSEDRQTNEETALTPGRQAFLSAQWLFADDWVLSPQVNWLADIKREKDDSRDALRDTIRVDMTLRKEHLFHNLQFSLSVSNLFDEDIYAPSALNSALGVAPIGDDFQEEGRKVIAQFKYVIE